MSWIDISIPVRNGMVHWPGDPGFQSRLHKTIGDANGSPCNLTHMSLSAHTGTHMDSRGTSSMAASPWKPYRWMPYSDPVG